MLSRRTLLATAAALAAGSAMPASAQALHRYQAGGVPEESILPALWAQQSGIFRHNGFELGIDAQRSGSAVAAAVAGGAYAIGKSSLIALISAHAHDIPFVIVWPGGLYETSRPNNGLMVKADSPLRTGADLNGKTIAVSSLGDLYTVSIKAWIDGHGGDSTTIKLVELPTDAVAGAIATGRIDAGAMGTPQFQQAVESGLRILGRPYDAVAPLFYFSAWFTTRKFLDENRPVVEGFARAMKAAATYVNGHPQQTIDLLAKFTGIEPDVIARMPRARMATSLDPRLLQAAIDLSAKYKVIPASFNARDFCATL